ncbi:PQQ-binding-like beta-propeller repeat protein [Streptomyces sp900116325]|uniref:outer membrane protein assembly factor BamB family protein n=1 Tax=Streptomyces sp. 900116325 TaxID=3154295 RepID=UPI0033FA9B17
MIASQRITATLRLGPEIEDRAQYEGDWKSERWRFNAGGALTLGPVSAGDIVLVADAKGGIYALDARSGRERWRHHHDAATTGIVATEQWVFVEDCGDLWQYDPLTGEIAEVPFDEVHGRPVQAIGDVLLFQWNGEIGAADLHMMSKVFGLHHRGVRAQRASRCGSRGVCRRWHVGRAAEPEGRHG